MKVAIIGGGFTGLGCAYYLLERGITPVVFEAGESCGGLARGFNPGHWKWNLESFYHHIFTNDREIIRLANKVGCPMMVKKPVTTSFYHGKESDLDSPMSLLKFPGIGVWSRLRMGLGLLLLKLIPNGIFLERYRATKFLPQLIGREGYRVVWEKLLKAKFGPYVNDVNMAWFWSRVAKRTKNLGYFDGGFGKLISKIEDKIITQGGEIRLKTLVEKIEKVDKKIMVNEEAFDAVVVTVPAPNAKKLLSEVKIPELNYLWGQTLILEMSRKFARGYWVNVLEDNYPFLVAVEHTNIIDKKVYGGKRILYLGNYLPEGHKQLTMTKDELIKLYLPYLRRINKNFRKKNIQGSFLFREPFAQPVFPTNYSNKIPKVRLDKGIYVANMSMVYPFDRGTNYAVKAGKEVAEMIVKDLR